MILVLAAAPLPAPAAARTWEAIDALRSRLERAGVDVRQENCRRRNLMGLYHPRSDTIVICRVHASPEDVWDTLAHEAAHRMQQCAGGSITHASHHRHMARALARHSPADLRSLRAYPRSQHLAELEARYTAKLTSEQVLQLFDRYCGPTQTDL
ncbi:hypothetical protein EVJ50_05810 [Synechococcus sp. RSCCF101]|nr:hypothetical protein EVJ50_05810 [Synechococcus sp. RSCCF101]